MTSDRNIRVFCPEHSVGFEALAGAAIHCKNKEEEHLLAPNFPADDFWEYCCDCNSFYPLQLANTARRERNLDNEQCVNCKRQSIRHYLCNQCNVVSAESKEKGEKLYRITTTGFVNPARGPIRGECPGCLQPTQTVVNEHHCKKLEIAFTTLASVCPFCGDEIQSHVRTPAQQNTSNLQSQIQPDEQALPDPTTSENESFVVADSGSEAVAPLLQPLSLAVSLRKKVGANLAVLVHKPLVLSIGLVATVGSFLLATPIREFLHKVLFDNPPKIEKIKHDEVLTAGTSATLIVIASDQDEDQLTYEWSCTGAEIEGSGKSVLLKLTGLSIPPHGANVTVRVRAIDPSGKDNEFEETIAIQPPPENHKPMLRYISVSRSVVAVGESIGLMATSTDEDTSDVLTYEWKCSNGSATFSGSGATSVLNTINIDAGSGPVPLTVFTTVSDARGASDSKFVSINVVSKPVDKANTATPASSTSNSFSLVIYPPESTSAVAGERLKLVALARGPNDDDDLSYQWEATNSCVVEGDGPVVWLNTVSLSPQADPVSVFVRLTVTDQHGNSTKGRIKLKVLPKPIVTQPIPSASPPSAAVSHLM